MKKTMMLCLALVMILALAGCQGGKKEEPTTPATTEPVTQESQTTEAVTEATTEEVTTRPISADDPVIFQLKDIDSNEWLPPTGLDAILMTASGRLTLLTNGELQKNVGREVTLAMDAVAVDLFNYGNGGYRIVLFVHSDGTLSAVSASDMIDKHQITVIDNVGGLKYVAEIYETQEMDAFGIIARTQDGTETLVDPYLN